MPVHITEVVVTGGPCSGKTTVLPRLADHARTFGYDVFVVPEMATLIHDSGNVDLAAGAAHVPFQVAMVQAQLRLAQTIRDFAEQTASDRPVLLLHDRAPMDSIAYAGMQHAGEILSQVGHHITHRNGILWMARDRYDAVLHLVTAARGAEEHYTLANNAARTETPEQARAIDDRTLRAWSGTPHLQIITNDGGSFAAKIDRAIEALAHTLGVPEPVEYEKKFLVTPPDDFAAQLADRGAQPINISQKYLTQRGAEVEQRIRVRASSLPTDSPLGVRSQEFIFTEKSPREDGGVNEPEHALLAHEYDELTPKTNRGVSKVRWCFVENDQYFELDVLQRPSGDVLYLLEIELLTPEQSFEMPSFLTVVRDVTGEREFKNANLAS